MEKANEEALHMNSAASPYLRGDGAASAYVGLTDPQGRTFRKWADKVGLPYTMFGIIRIYRKADIDRAWVNNAANIVAFYRDNTIQRF
jgi:hypothetical protein